MKFYDCQTAPSPRRVRMFMAEKNIHVPTQQVDLRNGEHLSDAFRRLNPWHTVPVLVLDDGTAISEAVACCRYLEEMHPEPPLMGRDARERAVVAMWEHRFEADGFFACAEAFRNASRGFKDRALTGPFPMEQIPQLAERGRRRVEHFFKVLDTRIMESEFVAGDAFSIADITAFVAVEFAGWMKLALPDQLPYARDWYHRIKARPSAAA